MRQLVLNEEQIQQLEVLVGEVPNKWAMPIIEVLKQGLKETKNAIAEAEAN
jgi:hypothetical protein